MTARTYGVRLAGSEGGQGRHHGPIPREHGQRLPVGKNADQHIVELHTRRLAASFKQASATPLAS